MTEFVVWRDGEFLTADTAVITADNPALAHGYAVFTSCAVYGGKVLAPRLHAKRLIDNAVELGFEIASSDYATEESIINGLLAVARKIADFPQSRMRVMLLPKRGAGLTVGSAVSELSLLITAGETHSSQAKQVVTAPWKRNENGALTGLKSNSYAENTIALKYARNRQAQEAIFRNNSGQWCEGITANVIFEIEGSLVMPAPSTGCLPGITRALLLKIAEESGVMVASAELGDNSLIFPSPAEQKSTSLLGVALVGTFRNINVIEGWDGQRLTKTSGLLALAELFEENYRNYLL